MAKLETRPPLSEWTQFKEDKAKLEREKQIKTKAAPIYDPAPPAPKKPLEVPEETTEYWVGVRDGSPRQYITLGNVCFPKYTESVKDPDDGGMVTERSIRRGDILTLRPEQVATAIKRGATNVVRRRGASASVPPLVINTNRRNFVPHEDDVPLGRYVFMVPLKQATKMGYDWRMDAEPEALL